MTNIQFWFNQTHHFLTGVERGLYNNDSIVLSKDCFGPQFVTKINEFAAMTRHNFTNHWVQEISVIYQLYYMGSEKCTIDMAVNDLYLFCWNKGCALDKLWSNTEAHWLYMTRDILDAAIVWHEGVPESEADDIEQWHNLSR